jgi:hypothetical protein
MSCASLAHLVEEVQQGAVVGAAAEVQLEDAVDGALQQDVVIARNHANLQGAAAAGGAVCNTLCW